LIHRERADVEDGADVSDPDAPQPAAAIIGPSHHVALLRTPELIVDYLEGPMPPEGGVEWAGVFRARDGQDHNFAAAEPPTHDSWSPELLPKSPGRTIVNVALREIKARLEDRWAQRKRPNQAEAVSTALVADRLSHLVAPVDGRGPGRPQNGPRTSVPGPARPKVDLVFCGPSDLSGEVATAARLLVTPAPASVLTRVQFRVAAALDGGSGDPDLDPQLQLVEGRIGGSHMDVSGTAGSITIEFAESFEIELVARRGPDTTVLFDVTAEAVK